MDINIPDRRKKEYLLVKAAQRGDQQAFQELYQMYYNSIFFTINRMVKNNQDAEDITIEAFTKAFKNIQYYTPTHAFLTWLSKIAINHAIDFLRKNKNSNITYSMDVAHPQADDQNATLKYTLEIEDQDPEDLFIKNETQELLIKFIEKLPPDYAEILKMRIVEDLAYKEIAKILKLPLGTVKARLHRGKELLKILINKQKHLFR